MSCFLDNLVLIFVQSFAKTDCPIFFLTAKTSDLDKISGFSHGADDYITKPFNPLEVVARMKAQLRRHMKQVMPHEQKHNPVHLADLKLIDIPQSLQ